jgi:hypothetical protein
MTGKITWSHVCFETTKQTQMHQLCPSCSSIVSSHCFGCESALVSLKMELLAGISKLFEQDEAEELLEQ